MRNFTHFDDVNHNPIRNYEAEQISTDGNTVQFYMSAVDGNSRKLVAVVVLADGQSIKETTEEKQ